MRRIAVLSTLALATLAACGGDSDGDSTSTTAEPTDETAGGDASTVEPSVAPVETTRTAARAPDETTEGTGGGEPADNEGAYVDAIMAGYAGAGEDEARASPKPRSAASGSSSCRGPVSRPRRSPTPRTSPSSA